MDCFTAGFLTGLALLRGRPGNAPAFVPPSPVQPLPPPAAKISYSITLDSADTAGSVRLHFGVYSARTTTAIIDWGDGSAPEIVQRINPPSGRLQASHNYAASGSYSIVVKADNPIWPVHDGALYSGVYLETGITQTARILTAAAFAGTVPEIDDYAFRASNRLTNAVISAGITRIGISAFYSGFSLQSLTLPATLSTVSESAFYNCSALSDVYFGGSSQQWNAVQIAGGNTYLSRATIHYNSM